MTKEEILSAIENLTVLELAELVEAIQEEFGVTAVVAAAGPAAGAGAGAAEAEKTEFDIVLKSFGDGKMNVIKAVKDVLGLGLKEAKAAVEGLGTLKEAVAKAEAEEIKKKLEEAGATIELK